MGKDHKKKQRKKSNEGGLIKIYEILIVLTEESTVILDCRK